MAVARYYSSNAVDTTLSIGCTSSATSITVSATTGFPTSYPYTLALDYDTSSEELVDVTAASGNVLTITRAVDGTTAVAHSAGAVVKHAISGRDMREAQEHINATSYYTVANGTTTANFNLHGIASGEGNVVGTLKTQTLTNKTLTSPTINGATLGGTTVNSGTISGGNVSATFTGNLTGNASTATTATTATSANTLTTPRSINGVSFNGSADITVTAAAGTLTGTTLNSTVTTSSLTSFGSGATLTNPTINGATINAASTIGGVSGTSLAADRTAWTAYTPALSGTGWVQGSITTSGLYKQIGKTVFFRGYVVFPSPSSTGGATVGSGALTLSLPVTARDNDWTGNGRSTSTASNVLNLGTIVVTPATTTTFTPQLLALGSSYVERRGITSTNYGTTFVANDTIYFSGTYEAA